MMKTTISQLRILTGSLAIGAAVMAVSVPLPAVAQSRDLGSIRVESQAGNGAVTGAVRVRNGVRQVQLPGGTWMDCFAGCHYTLRTESIDFWDKQIEDSGDSGQGGWSN